MLPFSEPVALFPGAVARLERLRQPAEMPVPSRFIHFHGPAELVFIEEGTGHFLCEDATFAFAPGTILYAPPMAVHDFAFNEGLSASTLVQFDPHALAPNSLPASPLGIVPNPEVRARVDMLADWLEQSICAEALQSDVALQLQALVLAVVQSAGQAACRATGALPSLSRFRPLLDHLDHAPARMLRLSEAAALCAMAPSYFSRVFNKAFGEGFVAYQTRFKLLQAARLLATSDEPVSQIGYRLGFRSHAYFSYCFKSMFSVVPTAHRTSRRAQGTGATLR